MNPAVAISLCLCVFSWILSLCLIILSPTPCHFLIYFLQPSPKNMCHVTNIFHLCELTFVRRWRMCLWQDNPINVSYVPFCKTTDKLKLNFSLCCDMICHIWYLCQPRTQLWLAESLTANIISWLRIWILFNLMPGKCLFRGERTSEATTWSFPTFVPFSYPHLSLFSISSSNFSTFLHNSSPLSVFTF